MTNKERFLAGHTFKHPVYSNIVLYHEPYIGGEIGYLNFKNLPQKGYYASIKSTSKVGITIMTYLFDKYCTAKIPYHKMQFVEPLNLPENANN